MAKWFSIFGAEFSFHRPMSCATKSADDPSILLSCWIDHWWWIWISAFLALGIALFLELDSSNWMECNKRVWNDDSVTFRQLLIRLNRMAIDLCFGLLSGLFWRNHLVRCRRGWMMMAGKNTVCDYLHHHWGRNLMNIFGKFGCFLTNLLKLRFKMSSNFFDDIFYEHLVHKWNQLKSINSREPVWW